MAELVDQWHKGLEGKPGQTRVILWSTPRASSTVFCKSMSTVPDIEIFFGSYLFPYEADLILKGTGSVVDHREGDLDDDEWRKAAIMICGEDCSGGRVKLDLLKYPSAKKNLDNPDPTKKVVFSKEIIQSMKPVHYKYLPDASSNYRYSFLLRHPAKVFTSYRKVIYSMLTELGDGTGKKLTMPLEDFHLVRDVPKKSNIANDCFKNLYDLWVHVKETGLDPDPVVLDSDDLLSNPAGMLRKYCEAVGIPYSDSLLKWDSSLEATDSWNSALAPVKDSKREILFCKTAFESSHFLPPGPVPAFDDLTADVKDAVQKNMPYYEAMYQARILPDSQSIRKHMWSEEQRLPTPYIPQHANKTE